MQIGFRPMMKEITVEEAREHLAKGNDVWASSGGGGFLVTWISPKFNLCTVREHHYMIAGARYYISVADPSQ